ncbi:helix-turn-helix domain-containing protein [Paenibacillus sp. CAU 1782]
MNIGPNIRAIRKRKGITIAQICEATGLSQGFMSQIETGKTSPSISTLEGIASVLGVPLAYLLLKKDERMGIVRKAERKVTTSGSESLRVEHLSSTVNARAMLVELPPGASTGETPHSHEGQEIHLVIKGRVHAEQGEDSAEFEEGDSFSWNACIPHRVRNIGTEPALLLISVYTDSDQSGEYL